MENEKILVSVGTDRASFNVEPAESRFAKWVELIFTDDSRDICGNLTRTIHQSIDGKLTEIPEWVQFEEKATNILPYWKLTLSVVNPPEEAIGEHNFELVDKLVNFPEAKESLLFYKIEITGEDLSKNNTPPYFLNKESDWGPYKLKPGEVVEIPIKVWDDENKDDRTKVFLTHEKLFHGRLGEELKIPFGEHYAMNIRGNDTIRMKGSKEFQGEYFEIKVKVTDRESQG